MFPIDKKFDRNNDYPKPNCSLHPNKRSFTNLSEATSKDLAIQILDQWDPQCQLNDLAKSTIAHAIDREDNGPNYINLSGLYIKHLPPIVFNLTNLHRLYLDPTHIENLPADIGKLVNLNQLFISDHLSALPTQIGQLKNLKVLGLNPNNLESLPAEITLLTSLEKLWLNCNKLNDLTLIFKLTGLDELGISYNNFPALSPDIGKLTKLTRINLSGNALRTLPPEIGMLPLLREILAGSCNLETLPPEIGQLANLKELYVSENNLRALPPELGLCRKITTITIHTNLQLAELPMSLGQIPGLTRLDIQGTAVHEELSNAILNQCRLLRDEKAADMLPSRVNTWRTIAQSDVILEEISTFTLAQRYNINEWLMRLERTRDFTLSQAKLGQIVCDILQTVCQNSRFRELFFSQIGANIEHCEDRAAMSLNEIYTSWIINTLPEQTPLNEKLHIMTGCAKTLALRQEIAKLIAKEQAYSSSPERESVEIYLFYETMLKERLNLCSASENMAYATIGLRSWIDQEKLVEAVNANFFTHLLELPIFEKLVKTMLRDDWMRINEQAENEIADLGDRPRGDDLSDAVLSWSHKLGKAMQERDLAWSFVCREWYDRKI